MGNLTINRRNFLISAAAVGGGMTIGMIAADAAMTMKLVK